MNIKTRVNPKATVTFPDSKIPVVTPRPAFSPRPATNVKPIKMDFKALFRRLSNKSKK